MTHWDKEIKIIKIEAHGSYVYKSVLREVLSITTSRHYMEEIELLKLEIEGFDQQYQEGSNLVKVRLNIAITIIQTILSRETGLEIRVEPVYSSKS